MKFKLELAIKNLKKYLGKPLVLIAVFTLLCSHNLYLKLGTYFLTPNKEATLSLYNGTFEQSENIITRDRILDASILIQGQRLQIDESQWTDKDSTVTQFKFTPVEEGTYVTGVSTKPRNIELSAEKFNNYLKHDGILDMLEYRRNNNMLTEDAIESYQKHVKAIYQVGDTKTDDWKTVLGYPIEFIPLSNPYEKYTGDSIDVKLLLDGVPLANQLVYSDYVKLTHNHDHGDHDHGHHHEGHSHKDKEEGQSHEHSEHDHDDHHHDDSHHAHEEGKSKKPTQEHTHENGKQLQTNEAGIVTVDFPEDGIYYLRTIHMVNMDKDELTHESKWATLTFEVTHSHDDHAHEHDHEDGISTYIFIIGSAVLIGILFFIFRKQGS